LFPDFLFVEVVVLVGMRERTAEGGQQDALPAFSGFGNPAVVMVAVVVIMMAMVVIVVMGVIMVRVFGFRVVRVDVHGVSLVQLYRPGRRRRLSLVFR
jgi:hypothetical protein